jgi:hypothetical protein
MSGSARRKDLDNDDAGSHGAAGAYARNLHGLDAQAMTTDVDAAGPLIRVDKRIRTIDALLALQRWDLIVEELEQLIVDARLAQAFARDRA